MACALVAAQAAPVAAQPGDWGVTRDPFDKTVIARYKSILAKNPHDGSALAKLLETYRRYRTVDLLKEEYQKLLDKNGNDWAALVVMGRLHRTRKLFAFLRRHRHEIFDEAFQDELATMYRDTGAGSEPRPPALLAMVVLLQAYLKTSDAEAVELVMMDRRWQLVLDCAGAEAPLFSQGALEAFRARLIAHDLDLRVLQRLS